MNTIPRSMVRVWIAAGALTICLGGCSTAPAAAPSGSPYESPTMLGAVGAISTQASGPAGALAAPRGCHAADGGFLPDPACTPGETDPRVTAGTISTTICTSGYTATVRPPASVTDPIKRERMAMYGIASHPLSDEELDHLLPLELGGATTVANLWPEPWADPRGAHRKDALENALKRQVCAGTLSLAAAQHAVTSNWENAYRSIVGPLP